MTELKYIGAGAWIPGVPARDLTAEEATIYADLIEATIAAGHILYSANPPKTTTVDEAADVPSVKKGR